MNEKLSGRLVLVVGPSGVGKDSIIDGARARFSGLSDIVFQRRVITREAVAGTEDHDTLSVEAFEVEKKRGAFALNWQAHGLHYGVPIVIVDEIATGRTVIVNVSRTVVDNASMLFPGTQTIMVTASPETIACRLAARGRESLEEIKSRLARSVEMPMPGENRWVIENNGTLQNAVDHFVDIVERTRIHSIAEFE